MVPTMGLRWAAIEGDSARAKLLLLIRFFGLGAFTFRKCISFTLKVLAKASANNLNE